MPTKPFRPFCAVQLLLVRAGHVLLARRANTGFADGQYGLVAGHIDGAESARAAVIREASEEAGISISPEDLVLVVTMHRHSPDREYIDLFFNAGAWRGEPKVGEPDKCDHIDWFAIDELPLTTIDYVRRAVECFRDGVTYCEFGWRSAEL